MLDVRTRRLRELRRESGAVAAAAGAARAQIARLTTLERRLTPDERGAVTRLRLAIEAHWLRLREMRDVFEEQRSPRG